MIRHGSSQAPPAVSALAVTVVKSAFGTLLVAAVGAAPLMAPGLSAAFDAAVTLAAVATRAQEEDCVAFPAHAKPHSEDYFVAGRHPSSQRGLDNGSGSVAV